MVRFLWLALTQKQFRFVIALLWRVLNEDVLVHSEVWLLNTLSEGKLGDVKTVHLSGLMSNSMLVLLMDLLYLKDVRMALKLLVSALCLDSTLIHDHNMISQVDEINSVCHQDSCLLIHEPNDHLLEDGLSDLLIEGRYRVIKDQDIRLLVDSPS